MPTYEYACKACDHRFEVVQSFSEDALTTCPDCEQEALRKVYNAAGIIFKGDGWHIKDYAKSKSSTAPTSTTSDGSSGSSEKSSTEGTNGSSGAAKRKKRKKGGSGDTSSSTSSSTANRPAAS